MFHGHFVYFQKLPLEGRLNTKPGDHGIPNVRNRWLIMFYQVWGPVWMNIHWSNIWLTARSHMTSHWTWGSVTTLHGSRGVLGRPLGTFFWSSHNLTVTALASCVKWPFISPPNLCIFPYTGWARVWSPCTIALAKVCRLRSYDRGEPAVSYKWTGWFWDITGKTVGDCRKITNRFRGIYRIYPYSIKESRRMFNM